MALSTTKPPVPPDESTSAFDDQLHGTWAERYLSTWNSYARDIGIVQEVLQDEVKHQRWSFTMSIVEGFCGGCRDMLQHWPDLSTGGDEALARGRSFSSVCEIEWAALHGCKFCAFLHSCLVQSELIIAYHNITSRLRAFGHDGSMSLTIKKCGEAFETPLTPHVMWLNLPGMEVTSPNSWGIVRFFSFGRRSLPTSWQHEENRDLYAIARTWLRDCDDSHETCLRKKEYERPSRLVSFSHDVVRVVSTEIFDIMPKYATLSYCWGLNPFLKLTRNTMELFLTGVSVDDLPQTFRDAIHVAKELGLSYIWIDALCIIQHDPEDWSTESGRMRSVYGNSYVNLAASSATNVHEGFFWRPDNYKNFNAGFSALVSTAKCSAVCDFYSMYDTGEITPETTHLATRAWALQERLLSPRTIYFGKTGMLWECRRLMLSEFLPHGQRWLGEGDGAHLVRPENQTWEWERIVSLYFRTNLTDPEDRLPALAGIARRQHEVTGYQYIAGMWKESLLAHICWRASGRWRRPAWRAPSWSWMAVDGPVSVWLGMWGLFSPEPERARQYVSVLDVWSTPTGPDPFGKVSDGLLSLACTALVRARLLVPDELEKGSDEQTSAHNQFVAVDTIRANLPVRMDCLGEECGGNEVYLLPIHRLPTGLNRVFKDPEEYLKNMDQKEDFVKDSLDFSLQRRAHMVVHGLVLRACSQNVGDGGRFFRIGSLYLPNYTEWSPRETLPDKDYYAEFVQLVEGRGHEAFQDDRPCEPESTDYIQRHLNINIE